MNGYPEYRDGLLGLARRASALEFDDSGSQQFIKRLTGMAGDRPQRVHRPQAFGLSSVPPSGAEGILIALGGRSDRLLGIGFEHKDHRPRDLPAGAAVLYDDKGNVVFVKSGDGIVIQSRSGKIVVKPAAGEKLYLGGDGEDGSYAKVQTESGPSVNVYAKVG